MFPVIIPAAFSIYWSGAVYTDRGYKELGKIALPMATGHDVTWALAWQVILTGFFFLGLKKELDVMGMFADGAARSSAKIR